jgi:predicted DNA-binding transcriptional regulator AlpA
MKHSTILHELSPEDITAMFNELRAEIKALKNNLDVKEQDSFMTREQVADFLRCDLSTLYHWAKKGKLLPRGLGNRVYYLRSEVMAAPVLLNRQHTANK